MMRYKSYEELKQENERLRKQLRSATDKLERRNNKVHRLQEKQSKKGDRNATTKEGQLNQLRAKLPDTNMMS